jgi:hypothetical protein
MMMMIDKVMIVISLLYFWDFGRGEGKNYSIWQDKLDFGHEFEDLEFIETHS